MSAEPRARGNDALRLVAVLAHPDDETFIVGGTLALYAAQGVDVRVIYGAFGTGESGLPNPQRLAELEDAANALGIAGWTVLPRQGQRDAGDISRLAEAIAAELRRLRPNVVITFDATGGTGNVDHIAMGAATLQAVGSLGNDAAADFATPRLYAAVFARRQLAASLRIGKLTRRRHIEGLREALLTCAASSSVA